MSKIYKRLFILGRPASGKSEFIDFMKKTSDEKRAKEFNIGKFVEIDDFPWIWEKFMDDDLWEKAGYKRIYSRPYMPGNPGLAVPEGEPLLHFCMQKFNKEISEKYLGNKEFEKDSTLFIEFACGGGRTFKNALEALLPEILEDSAILFIYTTREESWRRNVARYQANLKHSILAHMVPKETFDHYYGEHDWLELTRNEPSGYLTMNGVKIPFVTMNNEPESTDEAVLTKRYSAALKTLVELNAKK